MADANVDYADMARSFQSRTLLTAKTATRREWQLAILFLGVSFVALVAAIAFARLPLARIDSFVPAYESALFVNYVITAILLLGRFTLIQSRALLVLAAGYLFNALMAVPHALVSSGVFTPDSSSAGAQTAAWLYLFWHGGFALFVIGYAALRRRREGTEAPAEPPRWVVGAILLGVVAAVVAIAALTVAGEALLPPAVDGGNFTPLVRTRIGPAIWVTSLLALLMLWRPKATVVDLCLIVVMGMWLADMLSAFADGSRFDLNFYLGRAFALIASGVVLIVLLPGMARERRAIAEQLVETRKMEAVGQLTGGIAHDFNNLLAGVIGNLEVAIDQAQGNAALRSTLDDALESALRGADLVKRLLAFSRHQPLRMRPIELAAAIDKLLPLLRSSLGEEVAIDVLVPQGSWPVRIDQAEFENSLLNLCINARDAMPGGGRIAIEVRNFSLEKWFAKLYPDLKLGDYVVLSVSDTGTGMPPDVIARAFEPFYTTKETGKGSGLGLSMVHGYMRQSGGAVKIYSEIGIGTSVSLYFPRGTAEDAAAPTLKPDDVPGGSETVLVVEDNPAVRKVAVAMLVSLGYRTEVTDSARGALARLAERRYDVVFSDIVMPDMNGIALAQELRQRHPETAVLLTSGFSSKLTSTKEIQALGVAFVAKPYRKAHLAQAVRAALESRP